MTRERLLLAASLALALAASALATPATALAEEDAGAAVIAMSEAEPDAAGAELVAHEGDKWVFAAGDEAEAAALAASLNTQAGVAASADLALSAAEGAPEAASGGSAAQAADAVEATSQDVPDYAGRHAVALVDSGAAEGTPGLLSRWSVVGDDVGDPYGHGTAMATAMRDAWADTTIVSIRALDEGGIGTVSSVVAAMDLAMAMRVDVISLSLTAAATEENAVLAAEVEKAYDAGVLVVCAAGNQGADARGYTPANVEAAMVVGAYGPLGARLASSNWGETVDFYVEAASTSEATARMSALVAKGLTAGDGPMAVVGEPGVHVPSEADLEGSASGDAGGDGLFRAQWNWNTTGMGNLPAYDINIINPDDFALNSATVSGSITNVKKYSSYSGNSSIKTNYTIQKVLTKGQWTNFSGTMSFTWPNRAVGSDGTTYDVRVTISDVAVYASQTTSNKVVIIISNASLDGAGANALWIGGPTANVTVNSSTDDAYSYKALKMNVGVTFLRHGTETAVSGTNAMYFGDIDMRGYTGKYTTGTYCEQWKVSSGRLSDYYATSDTYLKSDGTTVWGSKAVTTQTARAGFWVLSQASGSTYYYACSYGCSRLFGTPPASSLTYTLTIDPNGGSYTYEDGKGTSVTTRTLRYRATSYHSIDSSTSPTTTRAHYTLAGWYSAKSGGTLVYDSKGQCANEGFWWYGNKYVHAGNLTVYARWTPYTWYVKFNANGGTGTMANETMTYDTAQNLTANAFTRMGYDFKGWATTAGGSVAYADKASVKNLTGTNGGVVNLYAVWAKKTYSVTYDGNGSTGGSTASQTKTYGTALALRSNGFTRTGYTFSKWNTRADGGGTAYAAGASYASESALSLYAQWVPNAWYVHFDPNRPETATSSVSGSMPNEAMTYDTAKPLTANAYALLGYAFQGWNTKADGSGTAYADGASVKNLTATSGGVVTLYAQWKANSYAVTFDGNGATGGSTASMTMTFGDTKALTPNGFERTGYVFQGWNTTADGSGTGYADGAQVTNLAATDGATVTLYAMWKANQVVVTIPTKIAYDGMSVGEVSTSDSFDVTVGGEFSGDVTVSSTPGTLANASGETLEASSDSSVSPLVFHAAGTQTDTIAMSGTAASASVWQGTVGYVVDFIHPAN